MVSSTRVCWCFLCLGKLRDFRTFASHGYWNSFQPRSNDDECEALNPEIPVHSTFSSGSDIDNSIINVSDNDSVVSDNDSVSESEETSGPFDHLFRDTAAGDFESVDIDGSITTIEVVVLMLDLMTVHKLTDKSAEYAWKVLKVCMPNVDVSTFWTAKNIVKKHFKGYVQRIDICVNDCIAFWDAKHMPQLSSYKHSHRSKCPKCGEPRWLTEPHTKRNMSRKWVYFMPLAGFLSNIFRQPELVKHLLHDSGKFPSGHVRRSRGFWEKVNNNPHMNQDNRNLGLVAALDGVPYFKQKGRGGWPFIYRIANLPDGLSLLPVNCHMTMLSSAEFLSLQDNTRVIRTVREPKSLRPHMSILCDDLYLAYNKGHQIVDHSKLVDEPSRVFWLTCILLYVTGDWPGLALSCGWKHKGRRFCHYCEQEGVDCPEVNRTVATGHRKFLPSKHPFRTDPTFGDEVDDEEPEPSPRTDATVQTQGDANDNWTGFKNAAPHETTGIRYHSPLAYLYLFSLVWDICADFMHTNKVIVRDHLVGLIKGWRSVATPRLIQVPKDATKKEAKRITKQNESWRKAWSKTYVEVKEWAWDDTKQSIGDRRAARLAGHPGWIRANICPFGKASSLKFHDWVKFTESAEPYVMHDLLTKTTHRRGWSAALKALRLILQATSDVDGDDLPCSMQQLKLQVL
jgi:hypothetical protein